MKRVVDSLATAREPGWSGSAVHKGSLTTTVAGVLVIHTRTKTAASGRDARIQQDTIASLNANVTTDGIAAGLNADTLSLVAAVANTDLGLVACPARNDLEPHNRT